MPDEQDYQTGGYSVDAVANEFLSIEGVLNHVSPMKLQKLVYFAHGWFLAMADRPLVSEPVEAWKYGPVFPSLYGEFKDIGRGNIDRLATEIQYSPESDPNSAFTVIHPRLDGGDLYSTYAKELILHIWEKIGSYEAVELSTLTHREGTPWQVVASQFPDEIPRAVKIPNSLIRSYFKGLLRKNK